MKHEYENGLVIGRSSGRFGSLNQATSLSIQNLSTDDEVW